MQLTATAGRKVNHIESYSVQQFGELLQISQRTAYALLASGSGPRSIRVGRHIRILKSDLEKWFENK